MSKYICRECGDLLGLNDRKDICIGCALEIEEARTDQLLKAIRESIEIAHDRCPTCESSAPLKAVLDGEA